MILAEAGIRPGMRVLDLGCGAGDVAFVAPGLVGPGGSVVGVDRSPEALARARLRAAQRGLAQVQFVEGDLGDPAPGGPFDAIVDWRRRYPAHPGDRRAQQHRLVPPASPSRPWWWPALGLVGVLSQANVMRNSIRRGCHVLPGPHDRREALLAARADRLVLQPGRWRAGGRRAPCR